MPELEPQAWGRVLGRLGIVVLFAGVALVLVAVDVLEDDLAWWERVLMGAAGLPMAVVGGRWLVAHLRD